MSKETEILDGNEATAYIAYRTNEVCAIYPITPSSAMGEFIDLWASQGKKNIWGNIPQVIEMQSEAGAAATVHGILQGGALSATFTASQGLLLMIPSMYKIAGELLPTVFHIAARSIATHALSIFGDHSDAMSCRQTGFAMLFSSNVQEAMDMALIAQAASLKSRIPFLHAFDGFRTSHEVNKIEIISDEIIRKMIDEKDVQAHKERSLNPCHPVIRGTAQNPDVFFQNRESANKFYSELPSVVQQTMNTFAQLTGRKYGLYEYYGHPNAERIIMLMGSGCDTAEETIDYMNQSGEKVGYLKIRLFRPFCINDFIKAIPPTVKSIAVLDRTKEPGAIGDPLYMDVVNAFVENNPSSFPKIISGRYGLSSKEFTPAMVKAVFDELKKEKQKNHFTIGIKDDVSNTSLDYSNDFTIPNDCFSAMFYGLGADGTVGANKNTIKIIGDTTDNFVQGYFVYDSKKSGAITISHLRFGKNPIRSIYLITSANFVACHVFNFLFQYDVLEKIKQGGTFLLNAPYSCDEVWNHLPSKIQKEIINKQLKFFTIDATRVAQEAGLGTRTNTILQTCFFSISGVLPREEAIEKIRQSIHKSYSYKGDAIVKKNLQAVDKTLANLHEVHYPKNITSSIEIPPTVSKDAPQIVKNVLAKIMAGKGDELPVSAFPVDGTFPSATTQWEKRNIATHVPQWDENLCTQCNKCSIICPHAAIRAKVYDKNILSSAPETYKYVRPIGKEFDREKEVYTLQVAVEDCAGCHLCVEYCPMSSKTDPKHKAINMVEQLPIREMEKKNWDFFLSIPEIDRARVNVGSVKGSQFLRPLFEFSGACAGCGETPYVKLLSQLFGDEMIIANATGCSSIYGGNLPTTPWAKNEYGRGPAWANSLFEDAAEFGLGIRLAANKKRETAVNYLSKMKEQIGVERVEKILLIDETTEQGRREKKMLVKELLLQLKTINSPDARQLEFFADSLCRKSIWSMGGDGWAYDIGFGGLDHILSVGEDLNIMVLDTEVYSNTGGQASKATPLGASAKFSIAGKRKPKKKLALQAISYGNVYVAQIAMGANDTQTVRTINEANDFPGTSLIIAYSHCIAHGYDTRYGTLQQEKAVKSGHWPLFHFNPLKPKGQRFILDSKEPSLPLKDYIYNESRYTWIVKQNSVLAEELLHMAEEETKNQWEMLKLLSAL
ncbi:MAG: pyruvate:ferredoxin (flavodoxin) oxidoreductase [Bacteroidota bacterium]